MTRNVTIPKAFRELLLNSCISETDIFSVADGFFTAFKPISSILSVKGIESFEGPCGETLLCDRFFDDWYLYAVPFDDGFVYGLLKLREQEHDREEGIAADGDTPGVTVSFISFNVQTLFSCLSDPSKENISSLVDEIHRVVSEGGQHHHKGLKAYFLNPSAEGSYLIAALYVKHILSFAVDSSIEVPRHYRELYEESLLKKKNSRRCRLPRFIDEANELAGRVVCDHNRIFIKDTDNITELECMVILATHTGNVSVHSFAAEVQYHAKYLIRIANIRLPIIGKSVYASAIRADMTVDDTELEGPAPFHRLDSQIVKRHRALHPDASVSQLLNSKKGCIE